MLIDPLYQIKSLEFKKIDNSCLCALHEMKPLSAKSMRQTVPTGSVWDGGMLLSLEWAGLLQKFVLTVLTCSIFPRSDAVKFIVRSIEI